MESYKYESVVFNHVKVTAEMANAVRVLAYSGRLVRHVPTAYEFNSCVGVMAMVHEKELREAEAQGDYFREQVANVRKAMQVLFSYQGKEVDRLEKTETEEEEDCTGCSYKTYRFMMAGGGLLELVYRYDD